jgi:hypothetical protein
MTIVTRQPQNRTVQFFKPTSSGGGSSITWVNVYANIAPGADAGLFINQGATPIYITLPASPANGTTIYIVGVETSTPPAAPGYIISCLAGQFIAVGSYPGLSGQGLATISPGACIQLVYNAITSTWQGLSPIGLFFAN